jgi:hypothetical protein
MKGRKGCDWMEIGRILQYGLIMLHRPARTPRNY